ncbi:conserved hypothetical protein [Pediculus humanus corporis]|uniref:glucuronosyl-galactosyl-proteoglycan 4-alpha-N-acetylglucosaminyltransferase n=1 Tax=Pediculus humanus subsp. corporis TaxID=121224 RepID=E0VWR0_PEDHC|nr:uncharacterized protein Phum_PHUM490250 [Pediculus humanus corporis]EEB17816.1 conserved hypothetical protein [Pediculus humanus corporis]
MFRSICFTEQWESYCNWLHKIKINKIVLIICVVLIVVPLVTHLYLSEVDTLSPETDIYRTRAKLEALDDFPVFQASDLKSRIEEMLRIKGSVGMELRDIEAKRQKLQLEIASLNQKNEEVKNEILHQQMELERLKISVQQAEVAQREAIQRNTPELALPLTLYSNEIPKTVDYKLKEGLEFCQMHNCWDYSRCSITSGFPVYFYEEIDWKVETFISTTIKQVLSYNPHIVKNPTIACAYLVLLGESKENHTTQTLSDYLKSICFSFTEWIFLKDGLKYWGGDGRNHILLHLSRRDLSTTQDRFSGVNTGRAIIVQSTFERLRFRQGFDLVIPPILGPPGGDMWQDCSNMLPARRKYLMSFQGQTEIGGKYFEENVIERLKKFINSTNDLLYFHFTCDPPIVSLQSKHPDLQEWLLCGTETTRGTILKNSTFVLIMAPPTDIISSTILQARIYEALRSGSVPVILGGDQVKLSFDEVLVWKKIILMIPKSRISELHFILRSIPDSEILLMRRQGRIVWETYLSSFQCVIDTIVAAVRDRLGIPPLAVHDEPAPSVFNSTFIPIRTDAVAPETEPEENLGPLEPPYPSPAFKRNYTFFLTQGYEIWNVWANPFWLYPQLPFDPVLPSDAKFIGSPTGFRPIGKGAGGAGKEYSENLGGNHPREQFTIVMLTYEREQVLINSLSRLYGLPYLNKIIVVWNSPKPPLEDLQWPDIGVPIHVVKTSRNSLNNRFLPYDAIETEGVLSVDDDAHLRHDEIIFGFRIWREKRDRIVGFPGRFHAWDLNHDGWLYNSNYSCELSMVLTGAAFFHKYYTYLYSYWLPQAIRDKVDQYMNCEDIAMNFLVTSRWTFRCPGCSVSLSEDDTHFQERHKCIQFFSQVFGYTPLLNTQFRADSILFKTRIPHDKQKCFKFI